MASVHSAAKPNETAIPWHWLWNPLGASENQLMYRTWPVYLVVVSSALVYSIALSPKAFPLLARLPWFLWAAIIGGTLISPLVTVHVKAFMLWMLGQFFSQKVEYDAMVRIVWLASIPTAVQQLLTVAISLVLFMQGSGASGDLTFGVLFTDRTSVLAILAASTSVFDFWTLHLRSQVFTRVFGMSRKVALAVNIAVYASAVLVLTAFGVAFSPR